MFTRGCQRWTEDKNHGKKCWMYNEIMIWKRSRKNRVKKTLKCVTNTGRNWRKRTVWKQQDVLRKVKKKEIKVDRKIDRKERKKERKIKRKN